jgi:hypothetical protein
MNEELKEIAWTLKLVSVEDLKTLVSKMRGIRDSCVPANNTNGKWVRACQIIKILQTELKARGVKA